MVPSKLVNPDPLEDQLRQYEAVLNNHFDYETTPTVGLEAPGQWKTPIFVYCALMAPSRLLAIIKKRKHYDPAAYAAEHMTAGVVQGWARYAVYDEPTPTVMQPDPGIGKLNAQLPGVLIYGLDAKDEDRVRSEYFGLKKRVVYPEVTVRNAMGEERKKVVKAFAFLPSEDQLTSPTIAKPVPWAVKRWKLEEALEEYSHETTWLHSDEEDEDEMTMEEYEKLPPVTFNYDFEKSK